jgi:Bacterial SH3 domain.
VLLNGTGLYTQQDDGKMKYTESADAGEILELVLVKNDEKKAKSVEVKTAERTDGQKRDFIHVMKGSKDVWVQTALFAPNTRPVVITSDEAVMYKSADISGVLGDTYPQYLIAAAGESQNGFVQIYAYIEGSLSAGSPARFVKENCVSYDLTDVKAMQLLNAARIAKNDTAKKELLHNALSLNSSFNGMIRDAYNSAFPDEADDSEGDGNAADEVQESNSVEPNAMVASSDGSPVNVRADSDIYAEVVDHLPSGSAVYYTAISDTSEEVNGVTDFWYKISYPVEGWVFGEFVAKK